MLVIRLLRTGKRNQPFFKIVVTDKKNPPSTGKFVEEVGFYNPLTKERKVNKERVEYWLSQGVQPSPTVYNLLIKEGVIKGKKVPLHKTSKKEKSSVQESSTETSTTQTKTETEKESSFEKDVSQKETSQDQNEKESSEK